jgi:hypothetical protein
MSIAYNTVPVGYDIDFIARFSGVIITGRSQNGDGSTEITYRNPDGSGNFERVSQTIDNYAVEYLPVALTAKIADIQSLRNTKIQAFTFMGMTIVLDLEAKSNIAGAVIGLDKNPDVAGLDWSLGNGNFIFIPREMMYALANSSFLYIEACFSHAKELINACKACTDIHQLVAIDTSLGWPQG